MSELLPSAPVSSLVDILSLESKINRLESQVQELEKQLAAQQSNVNGLANRLPNTQLLSPKFLTRAFTIWGHLFVAQLIITVPIYCVIFGLTMLSNSTP